MRPHSVLDVADARHVEGVEPDGSACGHRERRYSTDDTDKRLLPAWIVRRIGEETIGAAGAIANAPADALAPFYPTKGERRRNAVTDTRPFDPALFGDAAIDPDTAKLNAR